MKARLMILKIVESPLAHARGLASVGRAAGLSTGLAGLDFAATFFASARVSGVVLPRGSARRNDDIAICSVGSTLFQIASEARDRSKRKAAHDNVRG